MPRSQLQEVKELLDRMGAEFEERRGKPERYPTPRVDVAEHDERFEVTVDLPGFDREDISVRVTDSQLHIRAEQEESEPEAELEYLRRERHHRTMTRTVQLPQAVDEDAVTAAYENGVLSVTLPKQEPSESEGRHIPLS